MKSKKDKHTIDMFECNHTWFLFLNAMILDGTLAKIQEECAHSLSVFTILRGNCDYDSGLCSMGTTLIASKAGCSRGSVSNAIAVLEKEGLIKVIGGGQGKRPVYRLFDKVGIRHKGDDAGNMLIPYKPKQTFDRVDDIQAFRKIGEMPPRAVAAGVNLNITINITKVDKAENVFTFTDDTAKGLAQLEAMEDGPYKAMALRQLKGKIESMEAEISKNQDFEQSIQNLQSLFEAREDAESKPELDFDKVEWVDADDMFAQGRKKKSLPSA